MANMQIANTPRVFKGLDGVYTDYTSITDIDDDNDKLRYRGYDIADVTNSCTFEEVIHLFLYEDLPSQQELQNLKNKLAEARTLPQYITEMVRGLPVDTPPMTVLRTGVSSLGCEKAATGVLPEELKDTALRLVAQMPLVLGAFQACRNGTSIPEILPHRGHAANVLMQLTGCEPSPEHVSVLDRVLTIHADHEFNASCFSARITASALTDLISAVTSAIGTLSGGLHGGANERVYRLAEDIGSPEAVESYVIATLMEKEKIPGFGQRGCRAQDPRVVLLRGLAEEMVDRTEDRRIFDIITKLESVMRQNKDIWPNPDLYSASILHSLGLPHDLFTPLFACSRVIGWSVHVIEQLNDNKLIRPKGFYVGQEPRNISH